MATLETINHKWPAAQYVCKLTMSVFIRKVSAWLGCCIVMIENSTSQNVTGHCRGHFIQMFQRNVSHWWGPRIGSKRLNQVTSTLTCDILDSGVSDHYNGALLISHVARGVNCKKTFWPWRPSSVTKQCDCSVTDEDPWGQNVSLQFTLPCYVTAQQRPCSV